MRVECGAGGMALSGMGCIETAKTVMRATAAEFADHGFEASTRALPLKIAGDTRTCGRNTGINRRGRSRKPEGAAALRNVPITPGHHDPDLGELAG